MVTFTSGRLVDPSASTTLAGTSTPVAVLPARRTLVRIALRLRRLLGSELVRGRGELDDPYVVAEWVADADVGAVFVLGQLRGELHAFGFELCCGFLDVRRREADGES